MQSEQRDFASAFRDKTRMRELLLVSLQSR
jgi:hypothetical protein